MPTGAVNKVVETGHRKHNNRKKCRAQRSGYSGYSLTVTPAGLHRESSHSFDNRRSTRLTVNVSDPLVHRTNIKKFDSGHVDITVDQSEAHVLLLRDLTQK